MNPVISNKKERDDELSFMISNIHVSFVNGIRRTILSEIPTAVFKTFPYDESNCKIATNTSRFNNEILKQRLSCIPIHLPDLSIPLGNLIMKLKHKNESGTIEYVTTEKFQIYDEGIGKLLSEETVRQIFPPNKITNDYIDFVKLRPSFLKNTSGSTTNGEEIDMSCRMSIDIAKTNSMFNVVSKATYSNVLISTEELNKKYDDYLSTLKDAEKFSDEELTLNKNDWFSLNAKRYYITNSFNFTITSLGVFSNKNILLKACSIIDEKFKSYINASETISLGQEAPFELVSNTSFAENCYDLVLKNEDYTVGKIIEFVLYTNLLEEPDEKSLKLIYVSFIKNHPHDTDSRVRLIFSDEQSESDVMQQILDQFVKIQEIITNLTYQITNNL